MILFLFFVPAILMLVAIVIIDEARERIVSLLKSRRLVLFEPWVALIICLWWVATPDYTRENIWIGFKFLGLPYLLTGIAGFLMQAGFRTTSKSSLWLIAASLLLLSLVCLSLAQDASYGDIIPVMAFLSAIATSGVALVAAGWIVWSLQGLRKIASLLIGVVFPISLFLSIQLGNSFSPEVTTRQNGDQIAEALNQYQANVGNYPAKLADLTPAYLLALPEAFTTQGMGWLYMATGDEFTLGYWLWPEKFGAEVCLYSAKNPRWDCDLNNWGPFSMVPTPGPEQ